MPQWIRVIQFVALAGLFVYLIIEGLRILAARREGSDATKAQLITVAVIIGVMLLVTLGIDGLWWFNWNYLHLGGKGPEYVETTIEYIDQPPSLPGDPTPDPLELLEYERTGK